MKTKLSFNQLSIIYTKSKLASMKNCCIIADDIKRIKTSWPCSSKFSLFISLTFYNSKNPVNMDFCCHDQDAGAGILQMNLYESGSSHKNPKNLVFNNCSLVRLFNRVRWTSEMGVSWVLLWIILGKGKKSYLSKKKIQI